MISGSKRLGAAMAVLMMLWWAPAYGAGEDSQILNQDGTAASLKKDGLEINKTVCETGIENYFDVTVTVKSGTGTSVLSVIDPLYSRETGDYIEFVCFYAKSGTDAPAIAKGNLNGSSTQWEDESAENTAAISVKNGKQTIKWDITGSAYQVEPCEAGGKHAEAYTYILKYRVRLKNEAAGFAGSGDYCIGDAAVITYRKNQNTGERSIGSPLPMVNGFFGQLSFKKTDSATGQTLAGAEFALIHSDECEECRMGGCRAPISGMTAVSDRDGNVMFERIPSGHSYTLAETKAPNLYHVLIDTYNVKVSYGKTHIAGSWDNFSDTLEGTVITNDPVLTGNAALPKTGGFSGLGLAMGMMFAAIALTVPAYKGKGGK